MSTKNFSLNFPFAYGKLSASADFRCKPEDFIVRELLGFELTGKGEHLCLHIQKTGENTHDIASALAKFFQVKVFDVGFCGLKDRHAVTEQWFSVYLPKLVSFEAEKLKEVLGKHCKLLDFSWHNKKLRRGDHSRNVFSLTLRNIDDIAEIRRRWTKVCEGGVPNYFGEQRFGRESHNLVLAERWFELGETVRNKKLRGLVMSAARSWLFNLVLAQRVTDSSWNKQFPGEPGSPSAPLWGRGKSLAEGKALDLEEVILRDYENWKNGLEHCGLKQERRRCILEVREGQVLQGQDSLVLNFQLNAGNYATSILRELCVLRNRSQVNPL